ncbi:MAG TPA: ADOP family duplicated permease [Acidobacteriaceae bacterium]
MYEIWMDLKVAARRLRHAPGFALTVVLSLTMAIAANLVVLGFLSATATGPAGIAEGGRLLMVEQKPAGYISQSYPDYRDLKTRNTVFSGLLAYRIGEAAVRALGTTRKSWDYEVSGNYFDVVGVQPQVGRFFQESDERGPNSAPYVVLSDGFWRSRFGGDPRVVGSTIELDKHPFTIIGVAPAAFHGMELVIWPDFWYPMVNAEEVNGYSYLERRYNHSLSVVGRLKPGVTVQQATGNLNAIAAQMAKQYPQTDDGYGARLVRPGLFGDQLGQAGRNFLAGILVLALLTLVAACVNLASVFAARAADRGRELAVRIAIGSSRWRVLRQVLAEAALLATGGGAAGALFASWLLRWLSAWQPIADLPVRMTVDADAAVYAAAVLLAGASAVLPALLTARQIWKTDAMQAMKAGAAQSRVRRLSVRDGLLGVQVALCALLVTCALVGVRGMQRSLHAPIGFRPQGVTLAEMEMKMAGYSDEGALPVEKKMLEGAAALPGVIAAGGINEEPLNGGGSTTPVYRAGTTDFRNSNSVTAAKYFTISPGYLQAAETRLVAGRDITWADDARHPHVALINETMARTLFGSVPGAVGQHFAMPGPTDYQVAGVVEDGRYDSLTEDPRAAMFWPVAQNPDNEITLVVRSERPQAEIASAVGATLGKIDPALPVTIESWPVAMALVLFPMRAATVALGILGLLAAMLAATGIFGMASYTVARRLRELGIRVALGAQRKQVLRAAMGRTVMLLGLGSVAGLGLGVLGSKVLANIVYEATVYDPAVIAGALAMMVTIGALAALVPAQRAVRVDPAVLLREE